MTSGPGQPASRFALFLARGEIREASIQAGNKRSIVSASSRIIAGALAR